MAFLTPCYSLLRHQIGLHLSLSTKTPLVRWPLLTMENNVLYRLWIDSRTKKTKRLQCIVCVWFMPATFPNVQEKVNTFGVFSAPQILARCRTKSMQHDANDSAFCSVVVIAKNRIVLLYDCQFALRVIRIVRWPMDRMDRIFVELAFRWKDRHNPVIWKNFL